MLENATPLNKGKHLGMLARWFSYGDPIKHDTKGDETMSQTKSLYESYLPMSESTFLMMTAMQKPIHGYGIILKVEALTNGRLHLGAGTIYGALSRFEQDRIIEPAGEKDRKKYYVLTETGRELLRKEYDRICELAQIGREEIVQ